MLAAASGAFAISKLCSFRCAAAILLWGAGKVEEKTLSHVDRGRNSCYNISVFGCRRLLIAKDTPMKTKRYIVSPTLLVVFAVVVCLCVAGLTIFLVYAPQRSELDAVTLVFLAVLLAGLAVCIFVVGLTLGVFDVVCVQPEEVHIRRFGKRVRSYMLSQNTQLYVQKDAHGAKYIEIQFPEYFDGALTDMRSARMRQGYVCIDYTEARYRFVHDAIQSYKQNNAFHPAAEEFAAAE